eukprot:403354393
MSFIVDAFLQQTTLQYSQLNQSLDEKLQRKFEDIKRQCDYFEQNQNCAVDDKARAIAFRRQKRAVEFIQKLKMQWGFSNENQSIPNGTNEQQPQLQIQSQQQSQRRQLPVTCPDQSQKEIVGSSKNTKSNFDSENMLGNGIQSNIVEEEEKVQSNNLNMISNQESQSNHQINQASKKSAEIQASVTYRDQMLSPFVFSQNSKNSNSKHKNIQVSQNQRSSKSKARLFSEIENAISGDQNHEGIQDDSQTNSKKRIKLNTDLDSSIQDDMIDVVKLKNSMEGQRSSNQNSSVGRFSQDTFNNNPSLAPQHFNQTLQQDIANEQKAENPHPALQHYFTQTFEQLDTNNLLQGQQQQQREYSGKTTKMDATKGQGQSQRDRCNNAEIDLNDLLSMQANYTVRDDSFSVCGQDFGNNNQLSVIDELSGSNQNPNVEDSEISNKENLNPLTSDLEESKEFPCDSNDDLQNYIQSDKEAQHQQNLNMIQENLRQLQIAEQIQQQNQQIKSLQTSQSVRNPLQEINLVTSTTILDQDEAQAVNTQNSVDKQLKLTAEALNKLSLDVKSKKPHRMEVNQEDFNIYMEFQQCKSQYVLSDKSSDRVSSDGEFNDAQNIEEYNEDDSHINNIEKEKEYYSQSNRMFANLQKISKPGMQRMNTVKNNTINTNLNHSRTMNNQSEGPKKTKRHEGMKYFKKVGYTRTLKEIPRWCTDMDLLWKVVQIQRNAEPEEGGLTSDAVFGKFDPKALQFSLREMFGDQNYKSLNKMRKFDRRGSSAHWNDAHEFATPNDVTGKRYAINPNNQSLDADGNITPRISSFSPFMKSQTLQNQPGFQGGQMSQGYGDQQENPPQGVNNSLVRLNFNNSFSKIHEQGKNMITGSGSKKNLFSQNTFQPTGYQQQQFKVHNNQQNGSKLFNNMSHTSILQGTYDQGILEEESESVSDASSMLGYDDTRNKIHQDYESEEEFME